MTLAVGGTLKTNTTTVTENYFFYFSIKTYVVDTQKNHLNETVLLSTQNTCSNDG